jgi:hypothetical protein
MTDQWIHQYYYPLNNLYSGSFESRLIKEQRLQIFEKRELRRIFVKV